MKFEEDVREGFKPFKIVVETQEEANYLYALVRATGDDVDEALDYDGWYLYERLKEKVNNEGLLPDLSVVFN